MSYSPTRYPAREYDIKLNFVVVIFIYCTHFRNAYFINSSCSSNFIILEYPRHCMSYFGPHSSDCLDTIWKEDGCLVESSHSPNKLPSDNFTELASKSLRQDLLCT